MSFLTESCTMQNKSLLDIMAMKVHIFADQKMETTTIIYAQTMEMYWYPISYLI